MLAEEIKPYKRQNGLNSKIYLVVNKCGTPINFIVTDRSPADCKEAMHLIEHIDAKLLLAGCSYNTNKILSYLNLINQIYK